VKSFRSAQLTSIHDLKSSKKFPGLRNEGT
jgi:hypothetical protein